MDAAGPGAIVRIWSANPKGTLRIYLDHDPEPRLEAPLRELLGGEVAGVPVPIAGERSRGWNCYLPIPYATHCKVTCDEGDFYYHVGYRTYPPGTKVQSFTAADLEQYSQAVARVASVLEEVRRWGEVPPAWLAVLREAERRAALKESFGADAQLEGLARTLAPDETAEASHVGPGAVVALRCRAVDEGDADADLLRQLLLIVTFDGEETVRVPLGDFFGAGPGVNAYGSLPLGVTPAGVLWSRWVMPYRDAVRFRVQNLSDQPVILELDVITVPHEWTDRSMYFHAQWRVADNVPTRPFRDWNYVDIVGRGVFVGAAFAITNPVRIWWGEGDEKIYVDGEPFPSYFGTGTEDYYGYAWCWPEPFTHAYHNQPRCDGPGNYGQTAVNRWHILDCIPFTRQFRFDMELWHWTDDIDLPQISAVTYWYAEPGAVSHRESITRAQLHVPHLPEYVPYRVAGALEGESFTPETPCAGHASPQHIVDCSGESHLWWRGGAPGDWLTMHFPVAEAGRYRVWYRGVVASDYGIAQLAINGQRAGAPIDAYHTEVSVGPEHDLGVFDLQAGANELAIEIVGANPDARPDHMFSVDYLRLVPVDGTD